MSPLAFPVTDLQSATHLGLFGVWFSRGHVFEATCLAGGMESWKIKLRSISNKSDHIIMVQMCNEIQGREICYGNWIAG